MNKREWVLKALRNEAVEKVPAGFWFHFAPDELVDGFVNPEIFEQNAAGHRRYFREFRPDFLKIMTDGFFIYPGKEMENAEKAADLWKARSIGADHPWIEKQVEFAKSITGAFGKDVLAFYNIFSPSTTFKFIRRASGLTQDQDACLAGFIAEDRDAVIHALNTAAGDLAILARRVITEGGADGVYFSTQDITGVDRAVHGELTVPGELRILEAANAAAGEAAADAGSRPARCGPLNILHICGYEGHRNDCGRFVNYPVQVFHWASAVEGLSPGEGKRLFGRPVIGGFDNTVKGILYRGAEEEIKAETRRILDEAGRTGFVLGADCTIPRDIDLRRLDWVREAASEG
jgi:uroporphyrinogen decarboxylase